MFVIIATIDVKPLFREPFLASSLEDARGSMEREEGCLQFSIVEDRKDPNRIYLFEVYRDEEAFEAHKRMPHFIKWRDTVKDWYAGPSQAIKGDTIFPPDENWKK